MPTGRAFVAVVPPAEVLEAVEPIAARLREQVVDARFVPRAQWHVTLQFLGNRVDLDATAATLRVLSWDAFDAQLAGIGAFASARRARVVWIGVGEGRDALGELATEAARVLAPTGFVPEDRAHHPHLTLARLRMPADLRGRLPEDIGAVGPSWRVGEVVLFESVTRRDGAEHRPIATVALDNA